MRVWTIGLCLVLAMLWACEGGTGNKEAPGGNDGGGATKEAVVEKASWAGKPCGPKHGDDGFCGPYRRCCLPDEKGWPCPPPGQGYCIEGSDVVPFKGCYTVWDCRKGERCTTYIDQTDKKRKNTCVEDLCEVNADCPDSRYKCEMRSQYRGGPRRNVCVK